MRRVARFVGELAGRLVRWGLPRAEELYATLGAWLGLAFLLAVLALWGFIRLAGEVAAGSTGDLDVRIMEWMDGHGTPALDGWARSITQLGSGIVLVVMALFVSLFLWIHGARRAVLLLWVGLLGAALLDGLLKELFQRDRPAVFEWRTPLPGGYGFPSGHALVSTISYTLFAFLVARLEASGRLRVVTFAVAALLIVLVALSRVYLGVHYPSDVLAGMLVGFTWAMGCVFAVYVLWDLRERP
jgi:membrane-associated phospholipid phosphatase